MSKDTKPVIEPEYEEKLVKHTFTVDESNDIGGELARALNALRGIETEFDQVKAQFKSREAEVETRINSLSTKRSDGFEMRTERCLVELDVKVGRKTYWRVDKDGAKLDKAPALVEEMTQDDYQTAMFNAESEFDKKEEIEIFPATPEGNYGKIIVGHMNTRWFTALRIHIGKQKLNEHLDGMAKSSKKRPDAIKQVVERASEWLTTAVGKDTAAGFAEALAKITEAHKEREE